MAEFKCYCTESNFCQLHQEIHDKWCDCPYRGGEEVNFWCTCSRPEDPNWCNSCGWIFEPCEHCSLN